MIVNFRTCFKTWLAQGTLEEQAPERHTIQAFNAPAHAPAKHPHRRRLMNAPNAPIQAPIHAPTPANPARAPIAQPVPHSAGLARPAALPPLACDSHMHIFDTRWPKSPHWPRTPPDAPVAAYRQLQERLGTARAVVVTPSTYGVDNRCTLDALAQLNAGGADVARGVAVVAANVREAELTALAAQRVCGLRVNFVSPQSWGETTPAMLQTLADKVASAGLAGWHIQLFARPAHICQMAPLLQRLPVPLVIDHMGLLDPAGLAEAPSPDAADAAALQVVLALLQSGRAWLKLSGAYMRSPAPYHAATPLARAFLQAAPSQLVWGSDWPHTTEAPGTVDDATLANALAHWCAADAALLHAVLVHNPARLYGFSSI